MSKPSEEEVYTKAKHVHCVTCDSILNTGGLDFREEDDVEQAYDVLDCCSDPFYEALIISHEPLFPPDDKGAETNSDFWNSRADQYQYNVSELLHMIDADVRD